MDRKILHLDAVAEMTNIPISTLRYWRNRGRGEGPPTWRLGRRVVAYDDEVRGWLDERRQEQSA